jgi:hypothetical protein
MNDPNRILRSELAQFLPSQRAIRAFEQLFDVVPYSINTNTTAIEEVSINASGADSRAQQALSAIARLENAVQLLELAPPEAEVRRKRYGAFYSTDTHTAAVINTAYEMTLNVTDISFGVSLGTPTSRVYLDTEGIYNFQFSAQLGKTTGGVGAVYIWCRVNGVDIPNSATKIRIQGNLAETVAAWNFVLAVNAGDYFELMWSTDSTSCQIFASAASLPVPAIPSLILTVTDNIS